MKPVLVLPSWPPLFLLLFDQVAAIRASRREFAQLVADHILGDVDRHMAATIMNANGMPDHLREDRARPAPGLNRGFLIFQVQLLNFFEQFGVYERPLFQ